MPAVLKLGSYDVLTTEARHTMPASLSGACGAGGCTLRIHITSPAPSSQLGPLSVPLVFFFSGFQLPATYYQPYAQALASWGYAVLRYDLPGRFLKTVVRDDEELQFLPLLKDWIFEQSHDPQTALYEVLDTQRVAAMGHSRGAKLAALALAGGVAGVSTAVLIDPVDMTSTTRRAGYPSAVQALAAALPPKSALLVGAGVQSMCNPVDEGWEKFWPALGPGSWRQVVVPAGHMQFADVKGPVAWALDRLCGAGAISHRDAVHLTQGPAVAWLQAAFRREESRDDVVDFLKWVTAQADSGGTLAFEAKPGPKPEAVPAGRQMTIQSMV